MNSRLRWRSVRIHARVPLRDRFRRAATGSPTERTRTRACASGATTEREEGPDLSCRLPECRLLIVGENRDAGLGFAASNHLDLPVHTENLHHLGIEVRAPALEVVTHFVGTKVVACEDLRHGSSGKSSERWVTSYCPDWKVTGRDGLMASRSPSAAVEVLRSRARECGLNLVEGGGG